MGLRLKKKRIVLILLALAAAVAGIRYGVVLAGVCVVTFGALLGVLSLWRLLWSRRGTTQLEACRAQSGFEALTRRVQSRTGSSENLTFVVLGDSRNRLRTAAIVYGEASREKPDIVFNTGDMIRHGSPRELLRGHLPLTLLVDPAPVFCVPGNHERGPNRNFAAFRALYGDERFAFECGRSCFVGFNNSKRARVTEDDLAFLDAALGRSDARYKFVFFHIPPASFEGLVVNDRRRRGFKRLSGDLMGILARHRVEEVFMGHIHGFASANVGGVRHTLTAGAGAPLSGRLAPEGRVYHYVVVRIDSKGIRREVVKYVAGVWTRNDYGDS